MKVINSKEVADWKRGRLTETALEIAKRHLGKLSARTGRLFGPQEVAA